MVDYWSLVIFTMLGQSAVGLMALLALCRREKHSAVRKTWVALLVLIGATIASLAHLADPMISYFAITNVATSWLSREILLAGLFGASMLAWLIFRMEWLRWLAAIVGVVFVYGMSRVYLIPTEPLWNTPFTFWSFLSTAFLLGATLLLLLDELGARCELTGIRHALTGPLPLLIALFMTMRIVFLLLQANHASNTEPCLEFVHVALLVTGGGLGLPLLARYASKLPEEAHPDTTGSHAEKPGRACGLFVGTLVVTILIWTAELCGRVLFYKSYVWFGM